MTDIEVNKENDIDIELATDLSEGRNLFNYELYDKVYENGNIAFDESVQEE